MAGSPVQTKSTPFMVRLWRNFVRSGFVERDAATLQEVFVFNLFSLLAIILTFTLGVIHMYVTNFPLPGYLGIVGTALFTFNALMLRVTKNVQLAKWNLLLSIQPTLTILLVTGGTAHTGFLWFFIFPAVAFILTGLHAGMLWTFSLILITLGLGVLA